MNKKLISTKILRYAKKIKAIEYLGGKCIKCKEKNIFKLTFHHRNPNEKEFKYNDYKWANWSTLKGELDKCDLLCQNCHREIHYNEESKYGDDLRKDKSIYLEYSGSKCEKCGHNSPSSLTFHHRNSSYKSFHIGSLYERMDSIIDLSNYIKKELDKCDVLCANCHVLEHSDTEFFNKYKDQIYKKSINYKQRQPKIDRNLVYEMYFIKKMKQVEIRKKLNCSKGTISDIIKEFK